MKIKIKTEIEAVRFRCRDEVETTSISNLSSVSEDDCACQP